MSDSVLFEMANSGVLPSRVCLSVLFVRRVCLCCFGAVADFVWFASGLVLMLVFGRIDDDDGL